MVHLSTGAEELKFTATEPSSEIPPMVQLLYEKDLPWVVPAGPLVSCMHASQLMVQLAVDVIGPDALTYGNPWAFELLRARGNTIEGGTTEILKNIIAERVLGLPRK